MESFSKIDLRDVLWWKSIKDAYKLGVLITTRFSKERCISLNVRRKPFHVARVDPPQLEKHIFPK